MKNHKVVIEDTMGRHVQTVHSGLKKKETADDIARNLNVFFASMALAFCAFSREVGE